MKQDNITSAEKKDDSSIELTITDALTGSKIKKRYLAVRGGLSYPRPKSGAYFCILAQVWKEPDVMAEGDLVLLAEHHSESLSLRSFYGKLVDAASLMLCRSFYTELPEERMDCGYTSDLEDFADEQKVKVHVKEAPDAGNLLLGIGRINSAIDEGRLKLPADSMIHSELRSITREDLAGKPEEVFPAINGLRHVLSDYVRHPPRPQEPYRPAPSPNPYY